MVVNSVTLAPSAEVRMERESAIAVRFSSTVFTCLLYTSDAADERSSVDLGGRRIIKKKKNTSVLRELH